VWFGRYRGNDLLFSFVSVQTGRITWNWIPTKHRMLARSFLALAVIGSSSANYGRYTEAQPAACPEPSCGEVLAEAEGLARAKLMRSYVSETVKLLESLMASLDAELVDIANTVEQHTGPACEEARRVLLQVAEPMDGGRGGRADLSAGIMEESAAQALEKQTYGVEIGANIVQETQPSSWDENSSEDLASVVDLRGSSGHKASWGIHNADHSYTNKPHTDSPNAYPNPSNPNPQYPHNLNPQYPHNPSPQYPHHSASNKPGHINTIRPSPQKGRQLHGSSSNAGSSYSASPELNHASTGVSSGPSVSWAPVGGPSCRALRGSPFLVPGLDDWCRENCANGYCPHTHCVCE